MPRVLTALVAIVMLGSACMAGEMPGWRDAPTVYAVGEDKVVASDGDGSTPDHYLLTRDSYTDFAFSFDVTRLKAGGDRLRAIVVWGVDAQEHTNRASFFLPVDRMPLGETQRVEVVKRGDRAALSVNGAVVSRSPSVYGKPLPKAPVGLLHYYNYHLRYTNIRITPLDADQLEPPTGLRAHVRPSGVVDLSWQAPPGYAGLVDFVVRRQDVTDGRHGSLLPAQGLAAADVNTVTGHRYEYAVAAKLDDRVGPYSASTGVRVPWTRPPKPVRDLTAVVRLDGSTRLRWRLPEDSRRAGFTIRCEDELVADRLAPDTTSFLAPGANGRDYAILALDPDARRHAVATVRATPAAPPVRERATWPTRHPYLRYAADDIERVRRLTKTDDTAKSVQRSVCGSADSVIAKPPQVPRERSDEHRSMPSRLTAVANAYAVSGDDKYAAWVRQVMLAYADLYPTLEPHGAGRARIVKTASGLYEATWYVPTICAYDMTYDSPVYSAADHAKIETNLLRPAADLFWVKDYSDPSDYRAQDLHYKCYNFQAWFISAVGLTGLLLRDVDMVEHALDGPYGLKHLLKHDVHDDGLFWERSLGYHSFVLSALLPFLEAAHHCNLDLWRLTVRDDYNEDREPLANYCVGDGDNGPKSIKLMFDAPFHALYGNRTYANVSDSNAGPLRANEPYRVAWQRLRDPKYAWLYWQDEGPKRNARLYRGEADASATVRLAYDDRCLYLAAQIRDDVVRNTHAEPDKAWAGDALWVGLKWRGETGGAYDFLYGLTPGDGGGVPAVPVVFNRFQAVAHDTSSGRYAVTKTADGYDLEFAIPWGELAPREGEQGTPLRPSDGLALTADFVLYDGDPEPGEASTKEKMLGWSCTTDRYDSSQGGTLVFTDQQTEGRHTINAPRADELMVDGDLGDWSALPAKPARLGEGSAVMTDAQSGLSLLDLVHGTPPAAAGRFDLRAKTFCNNGIQRTGCSLFPSTGFAILRERLGDDGLPPAEATCVTLNYGPHGGGHGHSDQLSLVVYAEGKQWVPDFGSCPYETSEKGTWTAQTISHNTVVVDETSQYPTGTSTAQWPCDSSAKQARGFLDFFQCDPVIKAAQARNTAVYAGVALRRTVVLVGDAVVDFFEVTSDDEHVYDYPLHVDGNLIYCSAELAPSDGALSPKPGYQHIKQVRSGTTAQPVTTVWRNEWRKLRLTCAGGPGSKIITGDTPTNSLERTMPMLIARRRAKATVFGTVMQPFTDARPLPPAWIAAPDGCHAVRVPTPEGEALVVLNTTGRVCVVDGFRVMRRVGVQLTGPGGGQVVRQLG